MVLDLNLPEDWDMCADSFRELWIRQIPKFNAMILFCNIRDMLVTVSIVEKASAIVERDSRREAVARVKSSA